MEKQIVDIETIVAADRAAVWKALTGNGAAMMPGTTVASDWEVGHPIVFSGEWEGKAFEDHGEILSIAKGAQLSFTHWSGGNARPADYHIVRYVLHPDGRKTKVRLTQFNVGPKADVDPKTKAEFTKTFRVMLEGLKAAAEARPS